MTTNKKIENALSDLVDGNIWPLNCPLETYPDQWITYVPELNAPEEFGDDLDLNWVDHMQVHWFAKGQPNYLKVRDEIRSRLREAGFTFEGFVVDYEDDTKTTHLVCMCSVLEEA